MALDPEWRQKALAWLEEKNADHSGCPLCNVGGRWLLAEESLALPVLTQGRAINVGMHAPLLALICGNCGCVLFLSAGQMGLMQPDSRPEDTAT